MQRGIRYLASVVVVLCLGCSKAPPKAPDNAATGTPSSGQGALAPVERPQLTPAAAPSDLFAVARFKSLATLTDTLGKWSNVTVD
jgi:hypothetical protein